jgi:hypothetical protein
VIREDPLKLTVTFFLTAMPMMTTSHVLAEEVPQNLPAVLPPQLRAVSPDEVHLGGIIEVMIDGLAQKVTQDRLDPKGIRLYLNERPLLNLKPETVDLTTGRVRFHLERLEADKEVWSSLLGAPPLGGRREIKVGIALDPSHELPSALLVLVKSCSCISIVRSVPSVSSL